jgi:hypothetical protein
MSPLAGFRTTDSPLPPNLSDLTRGRVLHEPGCGSRARRTQRRILCPG